MKPKIILLLLSLLFFGCGLPVSQGEKNPNVEVVVPESEDIRLGGWVLSPGGDRLIYMLQVQDISYLLNLKSKEKQDFSFCGPAIWLDDTYVLCKYENENTFVLNIDDFTQIPLLKMEASVIPDLDELLQTATVIYKYEKEYNRDSFYLLNVALQQNYEVITENVDEVLQGYDYKIIPVGRVISGGEQYSPDTKYYFLIHEEYTGQGFIIFLTIYSSNTKEKLAEYEHPAGLLEVGGWATDSSGVYFQPVRGGGMAGLKPGAILKLKVPQ